MKDTVRDITSTTDPAIIAPTKGTKGSDGTSVIHPCSNCNYNTADAGNCFRGYAPRVAGVAQLHGAQREACTRMQ